mmetsp:Transcript_18067/g.27098  ORF Transcript_18067/g.27098 Transcript_18067/m.27098 type:complete len:862 (-) Transcript_18067:165-2750(-)
MLRSADMKYVTIQVSDDKIGSALQILGSQFGKLHLVDICSDTKDSEVRIKRWKQTVAELAMLERKLDEIERLMIEYDVPVSKETYVNASEFEPIGTTPGADRKMTEEFKQYFRTTIDESTLRSHIASRKQFNIQISGLRERLAVYEYARKCASIFREETGGAGYQTSSLGRDTKLEDIELGENKTGGSNLPDRAGYKIVWGTVPSFMKSTFKRTLARISRLQAVPEFSIDEIEVYDSKTGQKVMKTAFYVVILGKVLLDRVSRLSDFINITIVDVPSKQEALQKTIAEIQNDIADEEKVLNQTTVAVRKTLRKFGSLKIGQIVFSPVAMWRAALCQEKAILNAKSSCLWGHNIIIIAGWIPKAQLPKLHEVVSQFGEVVDAEDPTKKNTPPTYFDTNQFTGQFQSIVDTYGIPGYKEVNPGLFTIVTFPFLFGVMYGDIGHGFLIACFGLWLVLNGPKHEKLAQKQELGEMMSMMHGARFVLFFMGCFGFYCGTIYNDLFSVPVALFSSRWTPKGFWAHPDESPYPYGVDPMWYGTKNQLQFFNSLKMKLSVILGVTQMTFGISLGALNHIREKDWLGLYFEWIPRMLFMICTFGYMIGIIIYKWCVDWDTSPRAPPNLIQTMIKMFLSPGSVDKDMELYDGQAVIQLVLILIALVSVPTMLFVKPLLSSYKSHESSEKKTEGEELDNIASEKTSLVKSSMGGGYGSTDTKQTTVGEEKVEDLHHASKNDHDDGEHGHSFSDVMIHQGIHTIEFVLGCVSNTASYLRLWALSLAHAELSEVFWSKLIVGIGLESGIGAVGMVIAFTAWFVATFAVLLCMDTMECVLHALRLHWVEFQNKFYHADGYKFIALDFKDPMFGIA